MRKTQNIKRKLLKKRHTRKKRKSYRRVKLIKGGTTWKVEEKKCVEYDLQKKVREFEIPEESGIDTPFECMVESRNIISSPKTLDEKVNAAISSRIIAANNKDKADSLKEGKLYRSINNSVAGRERVFQGTSTYLKN